MVQDDAYVDDGYKMVSKTPIHYVVKHCFSFVNLSVLYKLGQTYQNVTQHIISKMTENLKYQICAIFLHSSRIQRLKIQNHYHLPMKHLLHGKLLQSDLHLIQWSLCVRCSTKVEYLVQENRRIL